MQPRARALIWTLAGMGAIPAACVPPEEGEPIEGEAIETTDQSLKTLPQFVVLPNPGGASATYSTAGKINISNTNPFFKSFGNGRTCGSCHVPAAGWGITPSEVRARFNSSNGNDGIFRLNDGANSPNANVSTLAAKRAAYSMLLSKGLIRVGIGIPEGAEFELAAVNDPYGFASARELSLFRRPLPSTNLKFLSATMWDGRESTPLIEGNQTPAMLLSDLSTQSNDATRGHAEATADLSAADRRAIVDFEMSLHTAQQLDNRAGLLTANGASGGVMSVVATQTYFGINDVLGADPMGKPFDPEVFVNYKAWGPAPTTATATGQQWAARKAIARGQALFNTRAFQIQGVRGVNDALGVPSLTGTCTTCHDTPNGGNHSTRLPLDLGLTDESRRTPDMPLYTLRNKTTGELIKTTDPGRALITGKWKDVALFKGPILRALASRPPFFHNGSAATLADAVTFYNDRFSIGLTAQEKADLAAFLAAL
jgi:cytochrome c peroxidase